MAAVLRADGSSPSTSSRPSIPASARPRRRSGCDGFDDLVLHYRDLVDALGLERVHLVGYSLGGWIAADFAIFYPDRVKSLTLITPAGLHVPGKPIVDLFAMPPERIAGVLFSGNEADYLEYLPDGTNLDDIVDAYGELVTLARLVWSPHYDPKLPRRLRSLRVPTLVVGAEDDWIVPNEHADRWAELVPDARVDRIPGTGHGLIIQQPDAGRGRDHRLHRRSSAVNKLYFYTLDFMPYPFIPPRRGARVHVGDAAELPLRPEGRASALHGVPRAGRSRPSGSATTACSSTSTTRTAYGTMPSPNIMAVVHRRPARERIPVGVIGNALPLHDNPLRVAEEIAMLDVISGGRIISGLRARHGHGVLLVRRRTRATSRERFWEAHDLILKAWTEPGPFAWEGKHFHLPYVNPWPRPLQQPHPPIWLPGFGSLETIDEAAKRRYTFMQVFAPRWSSSRRCSCTGSIAEEKYGYDAVARPARRGDPHLRRGDRRAGPPRGAAAPDLAVPQRAQAPAVLRVPARVP